MHLREFEFNGVDKIAHFIIYALFGLFWATGLKRQNINVRIHRNAFLISVLGGFTLSLVLEILQEIFTYSRHFEWLDLFANGIGCIFGILLFRMVYPKYRKD